MSALRLHSIARHLARVRPLAVSANSYSAMSAIVMDETGDRSVLKSKQIALPDVPNGHVRVRVSACAVCHRDLLDRRGAFPFIQLPMTPGHEVAGVIDEAPGDRELVGKKCVSLHWAPCGQCNACVRGEPTACDLARSSFLGLTAQGGYAEYISVPRSGVLVLPESVTSKMGAVAASTVMCTYGTVWRAAVTRGRLVPGERVLVTGASGGVGSAAVSLLRAMGCEVTAVTGNADKAEYLRSLGAHRVVVHEKGREMHRQSGLAGSFDVVVEAVGAPTMESAMRCLRHGGRLLLVGNVTVGAIPLKLGFAILNSLSIVGSDSVSAGELLATFEFLVRHSIAPQVSAVVPLEEASGAQALLEDKAVRGRVVLSRLGNTLEW